MQLGSTRCAVHVQQDTEDELRNGRRWTAPRTCLANGVLPVWYTHDTVHTYFTMAFLARTRTE